MPAAPARSPLAYRYFFALLPDEITARRIRAYSEGQYGPKGLVQADRLHVTLAITADFDTPFSALVDALQRSGDAVAAEPFQLVLDQLSRGRGTAALRPAHSQPPLRALQAAITRRMAEQGVPMRPQWRFNPHVTLVYHRGEPVVRPVENLGWPVRDFVLVESVVGLTRHRILGRWTLSAPQPSLFLD
ncbi:MAG TPA: 2'-5' RNA ligase family protein [Sphingobium sp.]